MSMPLNSWSFLGVVGCEKSAMACTLEGRGGDPLLVMLWPRKSIVATPNLVAGPRTG